MGDKHNSKNGQKKKLTTKEKKAMNHLKLMEGGKNRQDGLASNNDVQFNKDKKAA